MLCIPRVHRRHPIIRTALIQLLIIDQQIRMQEIQLDSVKNAIVVQQAMSNWTRESGLIGQSIEIVGFQNVSLVV